MIVGIIGFGDMGRLYCKCFMDKGYQVHCADLPHKYEQLQREHPEITFHKDGFGVTRIADLVIFCVEAAHIDQVVKLYGPTMRFGSVCCGQTSVKTPEISAFEKYLPPDVNIVTCHSLHGPGVKPRGLPLVIMRHRSTDEAFDKTVRVLEALESKIVYLDYKEHDRITADTQAITHLAFLSMGTAWKTQKTFPWESSQYLGGIENAKVLMALRIYGSKWHVYAGLALMNPFAQIQVQQYASSVSDLFKLMIQEKEQEFRDRILLARKHVFRNFETKPILLSDDLLNEFSLSAIPLDQRKPNSHLSLMAMVDCWHQLGIYPFDHLICQTPPFRLLLGITEHLFRDQDLLEQSIQAALFDKNIRADDCEFYTAAKGWVECILLKNPEAYQLRFESTAQFFIDRVPHAKEISNKMLEMIAEKTLLS